MQFKVLYGLRNLSNINKTCKDFVKNLFINFIWAYLSASDVTLKCLKNPNMNQKDIEIFA